MRFQEPAMRLTIYIGESDRWQNRPLWQALLHRLRQEGVAGATVLRGMAGFGAHSRIHTATLVRLSQDLPIRIEVIDEAGRIEALIPIVSAMVGEGLVTVEPVSVVKYTHRRLPRLDEDVRVADLMSRNVVTVQRNTPLTDVVRLLLHHAFRALPVLDDEGKVVGIISDGDLLQRAGVPLTAGQSLDETRLHQFLETISASGHIAEEIMTTPVETIAPDAPAMEAATRMAHHGIKRLPVVDPSGHLVGMVSRIDLLRAMTGNVGSDIETLHQIRADQLISQAITEQVPRLTPDVPLAEVAAAVADSPVRQAIVVDEKGHPLGAITDGALIRWSEQRRHGGLARVLLRYFVPREPLAFDDTETTAQDLMHPVETVTAETPIGDVLRHMVTEGVKRMVVVDADGRLLGIADRQQLLMALLGTP